MINNRNYHLEIKSLSLGKDYFDFNLDDKFFVESGFPFEIRGDISARVDVNKQNANTELKVSLKGKILVPCDRCLNDMMLEVDSNQTMNLKLDTNNNLLNIDELELDYSEGVLNLVPLFNEEILINIPIKKVHKEGECNKEMLDIFYKYSKRQDISRENSEIDPRWAALKNISDNLKNN